MKKIKVNKKIMLNIIITTIAFFATCFVEHIINFAENLTYSNSIISLIIFASFIYLLKKTVVKENISIIKNVSILGLIFSTFLVIGNSIKTNETVEYKNLKIYLAIIFISFIIDALLVELYKLIEKIEDKKDKEKIHKLSKRKRLIIIFSIIIICWIPVLLAAYPGYFCYDAHVQFSDYTENSMTTWHPPLHTFSLGFIITTVESLTHSYNMGIFVYTCIQMLIVASCFTYCISFLEKYKVSKLIRIISIIYYALFPVVVMFSICSTKDTIFSAVVVVSIIMALEALLDKEKFINSNGKQIQFAVIVFLAMILRNNAVYAYIPFLIAFTISFKNKNAIMPIIEIIILYLVYTVLIYGLFNVSRTKNVEAFSVPLQQIARVYNYNYESLTDEELNKIYEYTTEEQLKQYLPECSDLIKERVYLGKMGYGRFINLWFEIGMKNHGIYMDSFLENTLGFWYPDTIINGYNRKAAVLYGEETSYFAAMCENPGVADSKIPVLRYIYYVISRYAIFQRIPVVSMLFSVGAMSWAMFIALGYSIYKRRKEISMVLGIIFLLWLTVLLGPMVLVRYALILFFGFPLILAFTLNGNRFRKE